MPQPETEIGELETKLGHSFLKPRLLQEALTHGSLRHEQLLADGGQNRDAAPGDNERLEFLGDAIVGLLTAESLFRRFPRATVGRWLRLGRSEERNGGRTRAVLLANCMEAVAAAIYLDAGIEETRAFVERIIVEPEAARLHRELQSHHAIGDYKSALQELLQARGSTQPEYFVEAELGPDHRKRFVVEVRAATEADTAVRPLAQGSGSTKKKAEQEAAKRALRKLNDKREKPANGVEASA